MKRKGVVAPLVKATAFIVVTVLATGLLGISIVNTGVGDTVSYRARFSNASGLHPGDQIRIAGVRVGQVEQVSVVDRRVALVRFSVGAGRELPASVTAEIRYLNLVGDRYIALERGVGPVGRTLGPGATIPLERTQPALDLTALFNGFQPLFRALSPKEVNKLAGEIVRVFQGQGATVESLLAHTASLTSTLAARDRVIGQLIDNLNTVLRTINARDDALSETVVTLQQLVSGLAADREAIGEAVGAMSELTETTAGLLRQARPPLRKDIVALGRLSKNLARNSPTIDRFLRTLPIKMERIATLGSYGSWLNLYLCSATLTGAEYAEVSPPPSPQPPPLTGIPVTESRCQ